MSPPGASSEQDQITRITERLRKDHPDPAMRAALYEGDKLDTYVRALMRDVTDEAVIARVVSAVRAAEDGQPHESAAGPR